jgi:hypothetical protein
MHTCSNSMLDISKKSRKHFGMKKIKGRNQYHVTWAKAAWQKVRINRHYHFCTEWTNWKFQVLNYLYYRMKRYFVCERRCNFCWSGDWLRDDRNFGAKPLSTRDNPTPCTWCRICGPPRVSPDGRFEVREIIVTRTLMVTQDTRIKHVQSAKSVIPYILYQLLYWID